MVETEIYIKFLLHHLTCSPVYPKKWATTTRETEKKKTTDMAIIKIYWRQVTVWRPIGNHRHNLKDKTRYKLTLVCSNVAPEYEIENVGDRSLIMEK